jgi:hypothetical protein
MFSKLKYRFLDLKKRPFIFAISEENEEIFQQELECFDGLCKSHFTP